MEIKEYYIENNVSHAVIDFTPEEVKDVFKKVYLEYKPNFTAPGFRKGNIPFDLFKQFVNQEKYIEDIIQKLAINGIQKLLTEKKEDDFVGYPSIETVEIPKENENYLLKLIGDVYPKINMPNIEDITIETIIEKNVESIEQEKITTLLDTNATLVEAEGEPRTGQYIILDFAFSTDKTTLDGKNLKPAMIEIGKNQLHPDTDERILSIKVGETDIMDVSSNEKEPLYLMVKVVGYKTKILPELTQEFLDSIHADKTMDAFRDEIKKSAQEEFETYETNSKVDAFFNHMLKIIPMENLPKSLVDYQIDVELNDLSEELKKSKLEMKDFLAKTGKTLESLQEDYKPKAEFLVKVNLIMRELTKKYPEIKASDEEIKQEKEKILGKYNKDEIAKIDKTEFDAYIRENLLKRKAIKFVVDKAKFTLKK